MRTIHDASVRIITEIAARALDKRPHHITQCDVELAEDGRGVVAYCYFSDDRDDDFVVGWDLAEPTTEADLDRDAVVRELLGDDEE